MGLFGKKKAVDTEQRSTGGAELLESYYSTDKATPSMALNVPAVARCIEMIAGAVAMLPVKLYRRVKNGVEEVENDPRITMLNSVTGDTINADNMMRRFVYDYFLHGGAYAYIERRMGTPYKMFYVPADIVSVFTFKEKDGIHKDYKFNVHGQNIMPYQMLKILRNSDGYGRGRSVIDDSSLILETMYQLIKFQKNQVLKGGNKKGFLKTLGVVGAETAKTIKENWAKLNSNENVENIMLLNGDIDFKEMSSTSVEMQLSQSMNINNSEIMRLFGTNDGVLTDETVKNAVMPVLDVLEAAFDSDLLLESEKGEYYFAFDTRELTRGSIGERYAAYSAALSANFMQLDEVRALEDLPPLGINFVKLGLQDVLLDPKTGQVYTPNTNQFQQLGKNAFPVADEKDKFDKT